MFGRIIRPDHSTGSFGQIIRLYKFGHDCLEPGLRCQRLFDSMHESAEGGWLRALDRVGLLDFCLQAFDQSGHVIESSK